MPSILIIKITYAGIATIITLNITFASNICFRNHLNDRIRTAIHIAIAGTSGNIRAKPTVHANANPVERINSIRSRCDGGGG